jgi:hypothetical protein
MANTYVAIATTTVGSGGAANIEFTSIPGTYTDLLLKLSFRTAYASTRDDLRISFNNSTTGYSLTYLQGTGTSVGSSPVTGFSYLFDQNAMNGNTATSNTFSNNEIYIPNYAGSNRKCIGWDRVIENNTTAAYIGANAGLWTGTAAITSIKFVSETASNFLQYSTATLYGIKNS